MEGKKRKMHSPHRKSRKRPWRRGLIITGGSALALLLALPWIMEWEPLGEVHMNTRSPVFHVPREDLALFWDETVYDPFKDKRVIRQTIFDRMLELIESAQEFIYLDFFLFNDFQGQLPEHHRALCRELVDALVRARQRNPELAVLLLTDPINRFYGSGHPPFYEPLRDAGVDIVYTRLDRLPDPNRIYSPPARWVGRLLTDRSALQKWLDTPRLENPLQPDGPEFSLRQWARLLHFKANHRKVLITDGGEGKPVLFVTSFNPADGSSAHDNQAVEVRGSIARSALGNELGLVTFCLKDPRALGGDDANALRKRMDPFWRAAGMPASELLAPRPDRAACRWVTDRAIREETLALLRRLGSGDTARIGMFYLADHRVLRAIENAAARGAVVRLILDANRDAFGRQKNGIPNRVTAHRLQRRERIDVRWADTRGEQYHCKFLLCTGPSFPGGAFFSGSANWTRRNIGGWNLEANVLIEQALELTAFAETEFDRRWFNTDGLQHTSDYEAFAEPFTARLWKRPLYTVQEWTGVSTF